MEKKAISVEDYVQLKKMGFLWEFFPEASGDYKKDVEAGVIDRYEQEENERK